MKGEITLRILEFLLEEFGPAVDRLLASATVGKVAYRWYRVDQQEARIAAIRKRLLEKIKSRTALPKLLYHLKKEGFIKENGAVTKKGLAKLTALKRSWQKYFFRRSDGIDLEKDHIKIIIFDIPEKLKEKREWLRFNLLALNFSKLQKSVYVGETKLPGEFIETLKSLGLLPYVQIFSVFKKGTF